MIRNLLFLAAALLVACSPARRTSELVIDDIQDLPELVVTAERPEPGDFQPAHPYRAAEPRPWDLLHTALDLSFDWTNQQARGVAHLTLTPLRLPQDQITLDAVGFLLHEVRIQDATDTLEYSYDGYLLTLQLPGSVPVDSALMVTISYTARPEFIPAGGSAAIRSAKGLYFINPKGETRNKPRQIWTQGETQANSRWFPTFDQPNARCTQEVRLTVDTLFETLSNGLLIEQTDHGDGTRTDHWRMDLPHAPYLFMLAIGDYAVSRDSWQGIPVEYYVEKPYAAHARAIFPDAPDQLSFFSNYTGVAYPWPKHSQVVVRDYVSGAMENTTGIIYGEFVQSTTRELIDERRNELICAHELAHHWFGDLVTCESWSNLVLNEGFANYSEYLWLEHKYGTAEAEHHRWSELQGYLREASRKRRPLVDFHYADKEDMFDAHSYNKGGLVLHMLRHSLGEDVFQAGLEIYLGNHQYGAVEVHDLRLAMEEASGLDLNWFFDQWYYQSGHPQIEWSWTHRNHTLTVSIEQVQDPEKNAPVYTLPTELYLLFPDGKREVRPVTIDQRNQSWTWTGQEKPLLIDLDPDRILLMEQELDWSADQARAYWSPELSLWNRYEVMAILEDDLLSLDPAPWKDPHWSVRSEALASLEAIPNSLVPSIQQLAESDPHSEVRRAALQLLEPTQLLDLVEFLQTRFDRDSVYAVRGAALSRLAELDPALAEVKAATLQRDSTVSATLILGKFYSQLGDPAHLTFFQASWNRLHGYARLPYVRQYVDLLSRAEKSPLESGVARLAEDAGDTGWSTLRRYAAFRALAVLEGKIKRSFSDVAESIATHLATIKANETDPDLLRYYQNY